MAKPRPLVVEHLEDRTVPATYGIPWAAPSHLTLSFAPDETPIASHFNQLFDILDRQFGNTEVWQREFVRAFQTWAIHANLSVGLHEDSICPLVPFGGPGRLQGDARFGDIRVAAHEMSPEVLSISVPPDPFLSGTLAGDIFLNSAVTYDVNNLFPILLHEVGHVLGLEHSDDPLSPMYSHFNQNTRLTTGDIKALQALYGVRGGDRHEFNDDFESATHINWQGILPPYVGLTPLVTYGDRTTLADVDYFWVETPPLYLGAVTFQLQTAGVSFLAPRLIIYDEDLKLLGQAESSSVFGDVVTVRLPMVGPLPRYFYVQVDSPATDLFGIGRYGLSVTFNARNLIDPHILGGILRGPYDLLTQENDLAQLLQDPTRVLFNDDLGLNFSFDTAERLDDVSGYTPQTRYERVASLRRRDVDYFVLQAARNTNVLTVTLSAFDPNGVVPIVHVYNALREEVPSEVLLNGNGTYTVQATGTTPGTDHYLMVMASPTNPSASGNYLVTVDFGGNVAALELFASGELDKERPTAEFSLYVAQSQLFQFLLSADLADVVSGARVTMEFEHAGGLFRLTARPDESVSDSSVFLVPGEYLVRFRMEDVPSSVSYRLRGISLSDPIGPVVEDTTFEPLYRWERNPSLFLYPDGTLTARPFHWSSRE